MKEIELEKPSHRQSKEGFTIIADKDYQVEL